MQDSWETTQQRVQAWQQAGDETGVVNGWELRRILSSCQWLPQMVRMVVQRSPFKEQALTPDHHWAFGLDKIPEEIAVRLMLDVIEQDMPAWLAEQARRDTERLLSETKHPATGDEGAPAVAGPLQTIDLRDIMLRHPHRTIVVFTQQPPPIGPGAPSPEGT